MNIPIVTTFSIFIVAVQAVLCLYCSHARRSIFPRQGSVFLWSFLVFKVSIWVTAGADPGFLENRFICMKVWVGVSLADFYLIS